MGQLNNKRIAILSEHGFEQSELTEPKKALEEAGASIHVISPQKDKIKGWADGNWGIEIQVDKHISEAVADDYDGLLIPGGVMNPDYLRRDQNAVNFVKAFFEAGKPIAAICHGPQVLIETGALQGRNMTSFSSIKTDLINAGANWEDSEVVVDQGLVTSRKPDDIPAFNKKMIEEFTEGIHEGQSL